MARLPTVGGDNGAWGTVLNDFLGVAHNTDGTLKNLFFNVKDYGAVGDGSHDDTAAIQATINAATGPYEAGPNGGFGHTVYLPKGVYLISSTLTVNQQFSFNIVGEGSYLTEIAWGGEANGVMLRLNGVRDSVFRDFELYGMVNTTTLLEYDATSGGLPSTANMFERIVFSKGAYGIRAGQSNFETDQTMFVRCKFFQLVTAAVSLEDQNCVGFDFYDCLFQENAKGITAWHQPLQANQGGAFNCYTCTFLVETDWDLEVYPTYGRAHVISGCMFERTTKILHIKSSSTAVNVEFVGSSINGVNDATVPFMDLGAPGAVTFIGGKYWGQDSPTVPLRFNIGGVTGGRLNINLIGTTFAGDPFVNSTNLWKACVNIVGANFQNVNDGTAAANNFGPLTFRQFNSGDALTTTAAAAPDTYWAGKAWMKIPSGTVLSAGNNVFYVKNYNCNGLGTTEVIYAGARALGGLVQPFTVVGEDTSNIVAHSAKVTIIVATAFTLTSDLTFRLQFEPGLAIYP